MKRESSSIMALASEVSQISGVQLGDRQTDLVVQRFRRRMLTLGLNSETEYIEYYLRNRKEEFRELLSLLTTHHSFFFREFKHFEILLAELPRLAAETRKRPDKTLHVWSAACSRGQEVFSLAVFLEHSLAAIAPDVNYHIWGTDIDIISVEFAKNAVFTRKEVESIPQIYQIGNFIRGAGDLSDYVRLHPRVKKKCSFKDANLLDRNSWPQQKFDVIFCRNVFIYFSKTDIAKVAGDFENVLHRGGALFLGLTETLNGLCLRLQSKGSSYYSLPETTVSKVVPMAKSVATVSAVKKVLCVDDSPTIIQLLKQIFTVERGFEVTATAANGEEALGLLSRQQFDLITLDIHMPVVSGIEFLKKCEGKSVPPVLVISSVDRQDQSIALEMMRLGADDYVEKPSLKDFVLRREEILFKAKTMASQVKKTQIKGTVDSLFSEPQALKRARGKVGLLYRINESDLADLYVRQNSLSGVSYKKLLVSDTPGNELPESEILQCEAIAVLSGLSTVLLGRLMHSSVECFLLEEQYRSPSSTLLNFFDIYPLASLHYAIEKFLRDKNV